MIQLCLRDITLSHCALPLVEDANLYIEAGDRVCLIGRNGAGKSSLLKLINGQIEADKGTVEKGNLLTISLLPQDIPTTLPGTVNDIVKKNLKILPGEDWQSNFLVARILSLLNVDGELLYNRLSGGMKRLVLLASILVNDPDVLMLDEPTNHLDIQRINLLETMLLNFRKTLIFITHDRQLLQKLATHIVEIDNGKLISWRGDYSHYLLHKETLLATEAKANTLFDKKLAQEEQWIRQGIKARRTRNEGRVRALKKMREERSQRRVRADQVNLTNDKIKLSGKMVFEAKEVSFAYQHQTIINHFSTLILRGDKVGLIGPNGIGKSTLVNLLLGNITPTKGQIKHGSNLTIGYFDQHRLQLDDNKTIYDNILETIDNTEKNIISYLQDFLFSPAKARTLVKNLSGGERNRVMLAKLFSKPCNVLVLDEPTNDLDIETLELLEERLLNYSGTLLLISHDRAFLNNVVTNVLVFGEEGVIEEFVGGYDDWLKQTPEKTQDKKSTKGKNKQPEARPKKLSFKEQKELSEIPNKIENLENKLQEINLILADPNFYKDQNQSSSLLHQEIANIENQLSDCYKRWEELEQI